MEKTVFLLISTLILIVALDVKAQFPITKTNCGTSKFCVTQPYNCDPEGNGTCLFGSLNVTSQTPPNGINIYSELSGNSSGYIALGLAPAGGNTTLYICARNDSDNGTIFFRTMSLDNSSPNKTLTELNMTTASFLGKLTDNKMQCVFNVSNLNATATTRSTQDTTFKIVIGTGKVVNGLIKLFEEANSTGLLDLTNPFSITPTTAAPTTTTPGSAATSVMPYHAALILISTLGMFALGTA